MSNIVVIGSSKGIGAELVKHFSSQGNQVIGVSRSFSPDCQWLAADISMAEGIEKVAKALLGVRIDALIFCAGVWEEKGFTSDFSFQDTTDDETRNIMSVNVIAPIELSKKLVSSLSLSDNPRAVYLGALSGLDNRASNQVAYSASKFALRGAIQALREALINERIGFTTINLGNVGTEEVLLDIQEGRCAQQVPLPMSDVISSIEFVLSLSRAADIGEIDLMQKNEAVIELS